MDKATAAKMVDQLIGYTIKHFRECQEHDWLARQQTRNKLIEALTTPQAKPQGEAMDYQSWLNVSGYHHDESLEAAFIGGMEAARVPPEVMDKPTKNRMGYKLRHDGHYEDCGSLDGGITCTCDFTPSKPAEPLHDDDSRRTPKGFKKIEAYTDYKTVVIMGDPYLLDGDNHNCDAMGCGSMGHVMARLPILPAEPLYDRLLEAAKAVLEWYDQKLNTSTRIGRCMTTLRKEVEALEETQGKDRA